MKVLSVDSCGMNYYDVPCTEHRMINSNYCPVHDDMAQEERIQQIKLCNESRPDGKRMKCIGCEKKTLYAAHKLRLTYRNELRRLYENTAEAFAGALNSLSKKGLIEIVEEGPDYDLKIDYLAHNVKGMSQNSQEKIILCRLTPSAKAFFSNQKAEEFLEQEIGPFFSGKVYQEAAKFNGVVKQVQTGKRKQVEEAQLKKEHLGKAFLNRRRSICRHRPRFLLRATAKSHNNNKQD